MIGIDSRGVPEYGSNGTFVDPKCPSRGSGGQKFGKLINRFFYNIDVDPY